MKQLAEKPPIPQPRRKRRRTEDTGSFRNFKRLALDMTRPVCPLPALSAVAVLWDTLEWFRHWEWNDDASMDGLHQECDRPDLAAYSFDYSLHL